MSFVVVLVHVTRRKTFMTIFLPHSPPEDKALRLIVCEKSYPRNPEVMSSIDNDIENANKRRLRRQQAHDKRKKEKSFSYLIRTRVEAFRTPDVHSFDFPHEEENVYSRECVFRNCC